MTEITDFEQLRSKLRKYSYKLSNNYMLPAEMKNLIQRKRLLFCADENGAYIFERRNGCLKLYFNLSNLSAQIPYISDTVFANVVRRKQKQDGETAQWLMREGFELASTRIHLTAARLNVDSCRTDGIIGATGQEAYDFFARYFDPAASDLPLPDDYGHLIAVRGAGGEIFGLIHAGEPFCIAVYENARRQGIAGRLFSAYAAYNDSLPNRKPFKLWADEENTAAQSLYEKLGYKADGLYTECYIYTEQGL